MTKQITLEEALKLVTFHDTGDREWVVLSVNGDVNGNISGNVDGNIGGTIFGTVYGDVAHNVAGTVLGTINGRKWKFVETPKEKLQRLIEESGNQELIDTFNQLEDS